MSESDGEKNRRSRAAKKTTPFVESNARNQSTEGWAQTMKIKQKHQRQTIAKTIVAGALLAAGGLSAVQAADPSTGPRGAAAVQVVPRDAVVYGNTYGEWSARWVQWWLSLPADKNPFTDPTGANCAEGQSGPVWFLAGGPGDTPPTRLCTVPAGKALFFPLVNAVFGASVGDCEPTAPGVTCNLAALRALTSATMDSVKLRAEIDGKSLDKLGEQRVISPAFSVTYPENASQGTPPYPAGTYSPNVGDGYWLMVAPLRAGAHSVHLRADITGGVWAGAVIEATYHLTVAP